MANFLLNGFPRAPVARLNLADQLRPLAVDHVEVVVGQFAPLLLNPTFDLPSPLTSITRIDRGYFPGTPLNGGLRLVRFDSQKAGDCAAKLVEEQQRAAEAQPQKGEVLKLLPEGTQVTLTRRSDGSWAGTLTANGTTVDMAGAPGAGPQSVVVALARLWVAASGEQGKP